MIVDTSCIVIFVILLVLLAITLLPMTHASNA